LMSDVVGSRQTNVFAPECYRHVLVAPLSRRPRCRQGAFVVPPMRSAHAFVAPTLRSAGADLKVSATFPHAVFPSC
jgi:hypothetical protein